MTYLNKNPSGLAFQDIKIAITSHKIWSFLSWSDIQQRYRGSLLGPFWITLSMVITIAALSIVYSRIFHQEINKFVPFLTVGLLVWTYITSFINESCDVFISAKDLIENIKLPLLLHVFRMASRNVIIFFHNFMVYVLAAIIFKVKLSVYTLFFIPGFLLVTLNLLSLSVILGFLGTRFRDIPPVITSALTVLFFVSPVTWEPKLLGENSLIIKLNPFTYYLDLIRSPLLGYPPKQASYLVGIGLFIVLSCISIKLFSRCHTRLAFWL